MRAATRLRVLLTAGLLAAAVAGVGSASGVLRARRGDRSRRDVPAARRRRRPTTSRSWRSTTSRSPTCSASGRSRARSWARRWTVCARRGRARSCSTSSSPSRRARSEDLALYDAIDRAGGAVLATTETDGHGRHERARRRREPRADRRAGRREQPARRGGRRDPALPRARSMGLPTLAVVRRAARAAARSRRVRPRRRADRLPRPARHDPDGLVLHPARRQGRPRAAARPDRRDRRDGADAARPARDAARRAT